MKEKFDGHFDNNSIFRPAVENDNPNFYYSRPYYWKHKPTGQTGKRIGFFSSELAFWRTLAKWNSSQTSWTYNFTSNFS